jgi:purine-binding chemotaxis protein CheW
MTIGAKNLTRGARELIAFRIGDQEFCVNIMIVREIRGWTKATPMPHSPHYMMGVINLRGAVLPIVDLSLRLGMKPAEPNPRHVIIVVQIGEKIVGLLVDAVSDILSITDDNIQPIPEVSAEFVRAFARGIIAVEGRMICLLELDALVQGNESEAA